MIWIIHVKSQIELLLLFCMAHATQTEPDSFNFKEKRQLVLESMARPVSKGKMGGRFL